MLQLELRAEAEQLIDREVRAGRYSSREQVVESALLLLSKAHGLQSTDGGSSSDTVYRPEPAIMPSTELVRPPALAPQESDHQFQLFDNSQGQKPAPLQSWIAPPHRHYSDEEQQARQRFLSSVAESRLGTIEERVAYILHRYPETRESAIATAIRYWTRFQPEVLEKWDRIDLDILYDLHSAETILRIRRHLQNKLHLFVSSETTSKLRQQMQTEFGQYLAAVDSEYPEVRLYLDETGNEGGKTYKGVGGLCVIEWRQYAKHHASLVRWREKQGWPETIHFSETGTALQPRCLALLSQLQRRRGGLLFVGYAMQTRGFTPHAIFALYVQLITDSLKYLDAINCLPGLKALHVVKEADEGFDAVYLERFRTELAQHLTTEFPNRVFLKQVDSVPKGREVMLECADLIAGGMQRRALYSGHNPKDVLAEAVFNTTGFEDPRDDGVIFKVHLNQRHP